MRRAVVVVLSLLSSGARLISGPACAATVAALVLALASSAARSPAVSGADIITTIAGAARAGSSGDGGPARAAQLNYPEGVAVDAQGNVYIADTNNHRVRRVSPCGTITTIAGTGTAGFSGDGGPARAAQLNYPEGVALDRQGNLYIADTVNHRVRKVTSGGTITTIAGGGLDEQGSGIAATSSLLLGPYGIAVDGQGNVYIDDNPTIRRVSPRGMMTTVAGYGGFPTGIAVDRQGNLYLSDESTGGGAVGGNARVLKVGRNGTITTIAGSPTRTAGNSYADGIPATKAILQNPSAVALDAQGNVYFVDNYTNELYRVRKVSNGIITTVVGPGTLGYPGDGGPASSASFSRTPGFAGGLAVDGRGNLYIISLASVRAVWNGSGAGLRLMLGGASTQQLLTQKGVTVTANCNEPCGLWAGGFVLFPGTTHLFSLTATRENLATPSCTRTLTLRLAPAALRQVSQLLNPSRRARATITVKAGDEAGHTRTSTRSVVLR